MTNTVDPSDTADPRTESSRLTATFRLAIFSLVALAITALDVVMTPPDLLLAAVTRWGRDPGDHQVHEMVVSALG
jgi:hypothetical protein